MIDPRDERIAELERALARAQTNGIPCQIEAALIRERLKATLDIGIHAIDRILIEDLEKGFDRGS